MRFLGIDFGITKIEQKNAELSDEVKRLSEIVSENKKLLMSYSIIPEGSMVLPQYRYTPFNGEKNDGALGLIRNYALDYYGLNQRSWGLYITSDIAKTVLDKYIVWIIDQGLKLKSNPARLVLETEGITIDSTQSEKFNDVVEARWTVWSNSNFCSYSGEQNLKQIAKEVYFNSKVGGDMLVILRYVNGIVNIQTIDGARVYSPGVQGGVPDGNFVSNGVEVDSTGKVVAYWIRSQLGEPQRIETYSKTGLRTAFLVKGSLYRKDYYRGVPIIAVVMESIGKLDRYKEAVVANAEEIAKIVFQIVHEINSDGANPFSNDKLLARLQGNSDNQTLPVDDFHEQLSKRIASTYQKDVINMGKGSELKPVQPTNSIKEFEQFYTTNAHIICAAVGIPPNVAFSLYTDSYSASRAATKDWDHTIDVERDNFTDQFYSHIYRFWLVSEIMSGKITAPGFVAAFLNKNYMVTEGYYTSRFTGSHFPHVDPIKEVEAERLKLGGLGGSIPLTTVEQSCEALGTGDSDSNMEQFADELENSKTLNLIQQQYIIDSASVENE